MDEKKSLTLVRTKSDVIVSEHQDTIRDIRESREKLGEFSLRDFHEAIFGEEFTDIVLGEEGGQILMKDVEFELGKGANGEFTGKVDSKQMEQILIEAHPDKSLNEIRTMLSSGSGKVRQIASRALREQEKLAESEAYRIAKEQAAENGMSARALNESDLNDNNLNSAEKEQLKALLRKMQG